MERNCPLIAHPSTYYMDPWICSICQEIYLDPVGLPCGHCFCSECLFRWVRSRSSMEDGCSCPVCRAALPRISPVAMARMFRPFVPLQQLLEEYQYIACSHCGTRHHPRRKEQHMNECPEVPVSCTRDGCDFHAPRRDHLQHQSQCSFYRCHGEPCGCAFLGNRDAVATHMISCPWAKVRQYIDTSVQHRFAQDAIHQQQRHPTNAHHLLRSPNAPGGDSTFPTIQIPSRSIPFLRDLVDEVQLLFGDGSA